MEHKTIREWAKDIVSLLDIPLESNSSWPHNTAKKPSKI